MEKISYLDDLEKQIVTEVICLNCKKRWLNVRPCYMACIDLECKYCNETGFVISTQEIISDETFEEVCNKYKSLDIYREKRFMFKYDQ